MEVTVTRSGFFTTVQDAGRTGFRSAGVPVGGAMDGFALRVVNLLVGNPEKAAAFEVTLGGAEFLFPEGAVVAVGGADYAGAPSWRPIVLSQGESLRLGDCRRGFRGYVAVRGGLDVPVVLGSQSTYVRAGWGGWEGRTVREGDRIPIGRGAGFDQVALGIAPHLSVSWSLLPSYSHEPIVRAVAGAQSEWFGPELYSEAYQIGGQSDRMGLRLEGQPLAFRTQSELYSSGVVPGTVQVPPNGLPIVLGADAQTLGGYAQAAHVVGVDLPLVAQLRPGDHLRFRVITLAEAQWLSLQREQDIAMLRAGLRARWAELASAAGGAGGAGR